MIKPVNGFIIIKQLKKGASSMFGEDNELLPNEFEVIAIDSELDSSRKAMTPTGETILLTNNRFMLSVGDTIIKGIHSGDPITVDGEEFYIIKPDNILAIKSK